MSHQGQEDAEAGGSSVDIPATPSSHYQQPDDYDDSSRPTSSSTQSSTADAHQPIRCSWCEEEFYANVSEDISPAEALSLHMQSIHPDVTNHSEHIPTEEAPVTEITSQEPDRVLDSRYFSYEQIDMNVEDRMRRAWKFHDVKNFTTDYSGEADDLETIWKRLFDGFDRPKPYEAEHTAPGGFLPITDPEIYADLLKNPDSYSNDELYTITANAAKALQVWQDEYLALDELSRWATRRVTKKTADPRKLEDYQVYEDKKEARLYGYKYDSRPSKVGCQNPFLQGGFKPTADQLKKMAATAADPCNVDGWTPVVKDGVEYVPRIRPPPPPEPKRKGGVTTTGDAPGGRNGAKRVTRYGGSRHPVTREGSQALTERSSPTPSIATRTQSPEASETPVSSFTDRAKRKTRGNVYAQISSQPAPKATRTRATKPSALGPNRARAIPTSAPPTTVTSPTPATTPGANTPVYEDPLLDPKNQLKIRQSKHPKRTEAMIRHWAKFNSEGRTRNPKRTKAQIEADKAAQAEVSAAQKAASGRKRRFETESEQASTGTSTPALKKTRRPASGPKEVPETGSAASEPVMQPFSTLVPLPAGPPQFPGPPGPNFPSPMQNGQ